MTCQLDSKTKQLGHRSKRLWRAAQPILGPWYGFSPRISFLSLSGLGRPILVANAFERLRYTAGAEVGQPVSSSSLLSCRSHFPPRRHPRQRWQSARFSFLLLLYFQLLVNFYRTLCPFWSDKCFVGAGRLFACRRAARCNEPFRIPLYEQLRDCRSQSLYWVSYL